jgi:PucR C-terminal helix-turn-helix domain/GGDEF-like domain
MGGGVVVVVRRLRARQAEIEDAVFVRVCEAVPEATGDADSEYVRGLRTAVAAAVEFGLTGIEGGGKVPAAIPREAVAQARFAARNGVSLEAVLRRYIAGHALLWDYVMQEADRVERSGRASGLREMSRMQAALLDQLVICVTREHVAELQRAGRSREQRLLEQVRMLLAGEHADRGVGRDGDDPDFDYDLSGEHLAVITTGVGGEAAVRSLAEGLGRRLLSLAPDEWTVWAWLEGRRGLDMSALQRLVGGAEQSVGVSLAIGEPARGLEGWRLTHRQAQAALLVATRRPRAVTRYADVALLAAALKDEELGRALLDIYLAPLEESRDGGLVLRQTLRGYLAAERNASSAAALMGVARSTIERRMSTIEACLGRTLHPFPAELEVALELDELSSLDPPHGATVSAISPT